MRFLFGNSGPHHRIHRITAVILAAALVAAVCIGVVGYRNATRAPDVRALVIHAADYPRNARPVRIVLLSDIHVHGPDMPPSRLVRIVDEINALHPDIDVVAGDFSGDGWIGKHYPVEEEVAPLRRLKSTFGTYAILGNNDANPRKFERALTAVGAHLLMNAATEVGPIAIGGVDGRLAHSRAALREARSQTYAELSSLPGFKMLIGHRPDEFVAAPPFVRLVVAGHTHCGQVVLPIVGPLITGTDSPRNYVCGYVRDGPKILVVSAGLGTSHVPLRIGTRPDVWLITIGPL